MIYCGRNIPESPLMQTGYVTEEMLQEFLYHQNIFEGYTLWNANGAWRDEYEDTFVFEIFDQPFDKITKFAQLYKRTFFQEAVYIKITNAYTSIK